jgi:hypothetical protein
MRILSRFATENALMTIPREDAVTELVAREQWWCQ